MILLTGEYSVNTTTAQHVSEVWECLVQISGVVDQQIGGPGDMEQISPDTIHELSEIEPVRRIQSLVYRFCFAKFRKTFNKWNKRMGSPGENPVLSGVKLPTPKQE